MVQTRGSCEVYIRTYIIKKHHWLFGIEWDTYTIKQQIPYIENPYYDGERNSNRELALRAKIDYQNAQFELDKLK